jgi:HAD superfamily hydrolase (TIGR01509 family)
MPIKAVIFDMDGVLSDTQTLHARMESDLFRQFGIEISPAEISREFAGVPDEVMFPVVFKRHGEEVENVDALLEGKWQELMERARGGVQPVPGSQELVETLAARGLRLAVASSSYRRFVELVLEKLNLDSRFETVVTIDDVERGKPDPAIFLLAAERLGIQPTDCLVIEDSISGMVAAKRAGMKCVGLVPPGAESEFRADLTVSALKDIPPTLFEG